MFISCLVLPVPQEISESDDIHIIAQSDVSYRRAVLLPSAKTLFSSQPAPQQMKTKARPMERYVKECFKVPTSYGMFSMQCLV